VLGEYQGGLRILELNSSRILRTNRARVRLIPAQKTYDEVDPLPEPTYVKRLQDPEPPAQGIPIEPNSFIPMAPAAAARAVPTPLFCDIDWSAWLDCVHYTTTT
jgi:hypothetical protein